MGMLLENYGLDFFREDSNIFENFIRYIVQNGKSIKGYYDLPYLYMPTGATEFYINTEFDSEGGLSVAGVKIHCGGTCVWELDYTGIDISPSELPKLEKIYMFRGKNGGGMIPIHIITSDILPGLLADDTARIQVVAQPLDVNYYENEDEYAEAQPEDENGNKWMLADGAMVPIMFLYNHSIKRFVKNKEYETDCIVTFRATVKKLYYGSFEVENQKENLFIRCLADTEFGELEFNHTYEQVPEGLRKNIKVGAVISGTCIISGDVAIGEYENGAVKNHKNDLQLLRYTFVKGEQERLRNVLAEDSTYISEESGVTAVGKDEIIERLKYVYENTSIHYSAILATITESKIRRLFVVQSVLSYSQMRMTLSQLYLSR